MPTKHHTTKNSCLYFQFPSIFLLIYIYFHKQYVVLFLYALLLSACIYLSTDYVRDTAVGAMNTKREQVRQDHCSYRAYILLGEICNLKINQFINQSIQEEKYQMAVSGMQIIKICWRLIRLSGLWDGDIKAMCFELCTWYSLLIVL